MNKDLKFLSYLIVGAIVIVNFVHRIFPRQPFSNETNTKQHIDTPAFPSNAENIYYPANPLPEQAKTPEQQRPKIAIIIDDLGPDKRHTEEIINLPGPPLTLSFLPYAHNLDSLTRQATRSGHELMIHVPMASIHNDQNGERDHLYSGMSRKEVVEILQKAFNSFSGYVGINNHKGSAATQDIALMCHVMDVLKIHNRNLIFVDSRTIVNSVAKDVAQDYGLSSAARDVFIDPTSGNYTVAEQLEKLEKTAHEKGFAIGIGHPRDKTIVALEKWLQTIENRGFDIVSVTEIIEYSDTLSPQ